VSQFDLNGWGGYNHSMVKIKIVENYRIRIREEYVRGLVEKAVEKTFWMMICGFLLAGSVREGLILWGVTMGFWPVVLMASLIGVVVLLLMKRTVREQAEKISADELLVIEEHKAE
jgi:hypothetical protein